MRFRGTLSACSSCGSHHRDDDAVCPHCGEAIVHATEPSRARNAILMGLAMAVAVPGVSACGDDGTSGSGGSGGDMVGGAYGAGASGASGSSGGSGGSGGDVAVGGAYGGGPSSGGSDSGGSDSGGSDSGGAGGN